jgi:hypothetical protein
MQVSAVPNVGGVPLAFCVDAQNYLPEQKRSPITSLSGSKLPALVW